jgi:hypothetical protein
MNWIKGQNQDSGSAYGARAKSLVNKSINQSIDRVREGGKKGN